MLIFFNIINKPKQGGDLNWLELTLVKMKTSIELLKDLRRNMKGLEY